MSILLFISIIIPSSQYAEKPHTTPFNDVQINCALRLTLHEGVTSNSMQQHQSWPIQVNGIKIIIVHSEMKHRTKRMLRVIRNYCFTLFLTVLSYEKKPFTCKFSTIQNTLHLTWCLLNINNISGLFRYAWRTKEWVIYGTKFIHYICAEFKLKISTHSIIWEKTLGLGLGRGLQLFLSCHKTR